MENWGFWAAAAGLMIGVAATLLRAMARARADARASAEFDLAVYRDQLAEIARDEAHGTLSSEEAQRLRAEVSRRLLEADRAVHQEQTADSTVAQGKSPLMAGVAALVVAVIAGAGLLYWQVGAPGYPDLPLWKRLADAQVVYTERHSQQMRERLFLPSPPPSYRLDPEFARLMDQLRATLADRPDDLRGQELLARNEAALGNIAAAIAAQEAVIRLKGEAVTGEDISALAELMIIAAGGLITPEAEAQLAAALMRDPRNGTARFYTGEMFAQIGRFDRTFVLWRNLLEESPPDAPWVAPIRGQIMDVAMRAGVNYELPPERRPVGPSEEDIAAAAQMEEEERRQMIEGMVAQLGERLATEGGIAEEWARLISSLAVLGRTDEARAIYAEAQRVFAGRSVDLQGIRQAAVNAGVAE